MPKEYFSFETFVQAFSQVFSSHLNKADGYRDNLATIAETGEDTRLAFIVETHVDFSRLFLWRGYRRVAIHDGDLPLFKELEDVLTTAVGKIDYIILAMCPQTDDEVVDALILNCASLGCSLSRQKMAGVEYVGYSRNNSNLVNEEGAAVLFRVEVQREESVTRFLPVLDKGERLGGSKMFMLDLKELGRAIELRKTGKPFLATFGVEMLLEVYGDCANRDWRRGVVFSLTDLHRWIEQIGIDETKRRADLFELNHGIQPGELGG